MREGWRDQGLQTLEELVLDAGEAVTYRRLAITLCFHVNQSKILLREFAEKHPDLSVSFLVCGTTPGGNARTVLCQREELKDVRQAVELVLFEHVYAISRSKATLESSALANVAEGFDNLTSTIGAISSNVCLQHSQDEIGNLKVHSFKTLTESTPSIAKTKDNKVKQNNVSSTYSRKEKDQESKTSETITVIKQEEEPHVQPKDNKQNFKGQAKSISNFFSKTNTQQAVKTTTKVKDEPKVEKFSPKNLEKTKSPQKMCNDKIPQNIKKEPKTPNKSDEKKVPSKRKEIVTAKRNGKVDKKRKRVLRVSDSEDSDEDRNDPFEDQKPQDVNMESDEDVIPSTPNADVVKISSGIVNPKKRRKIVDKTYTTEDGYMVTRKEEVLESCSEDESELKENIVETNVKKEIISEKKPPPTPKSKSKKKIASPQKGKQASIMSFFQKK